MIVSSVPGLKCKISPSDKIPLADYIVIGTRPAKPFLVVCDGRHLTDIEYNTITSSLQEGPRSVAIDAIETTFAKGVVGLPSHLVSTYENAKSFLLAEIPAGAAVLLRNILEYFVVQNFVVDCFQGTALNLKSTQDAQVYDNLLRVVDKKLTMSFVLETMADNLDNRGSYYRRRIILRQGTGRNIPGNLEKDQFFSFIQTNRGTNRTIDAVLSRELYSAFLDLSESVHGRHTPAINRLDDILGHLLNGIGDYRVTNGNTWKVIP